ncbi:MAG: restriction endonuclease subunit S [Kiritimatiellae bacterium]|nr:restriction endonuclease subunit S [Kiritimatiellia bacterium]
MKATKFKSSELGPIPVDWEVKRLGELWSSFKTGPFGSSLHAQDYIENGTPLINPMHIQDGKIEPSADMTVDDSTKHRLSAYKLSQDDIVVGRRGEMGRAALVGEKENGWLCGTGCFFLHLKESCCPSYIALYLRTPTSVASLNGEAVGTTLVNLNQKILSDLKLPLPPLVEQRRIARALSDVDELISALGKLIEKKRNIKTGAMQELLTGKTRLPGFKGKWVEKRLGECGTWLGGGTPSTDIPHYWQGSVPWISSSDIEEGNIWNVSKTRFVSNDGIVNSAACICPRGTIHIVTCVGIGKVAIATEPVCTSQDYANLVSAQCDNKFLAFLISVVMLSKKEETQGTSIKGITLEDLKKIVLSVPPTLAEQKAIAAVLSDMDAEIAALEADRAKYESIKQGMMQELLTGKTRLEA